MVSSIPDVSSITIENATPIEDLLKSICGVDFDEYVRRALGEPFPSSRQVDNLWHGRRFRLYSGPNESREGKIVCWNQWNSGLDSPCTFWQVNVEMDSFGPGDDVILDGLKSAKQHNGKTGKIIEYFEKGDHEGRFQIKLEDETFIAVKPQNLTTTHTPYVVYRMNIEGGGILKPYEDTPFTLGSGRKLSLEWLEPALPAINLDEGPLKANCPICRAVEPPLAAYDDAPTETEAECPICLEVTLCRVLQCEHGVCHACWKIWRSTSSTIPVPAPQFDPDELQEQREGNSEELYAILPHTVGGSGTKPGDSAEAFIAAEERFGERARELLTILMQMAHSGDEGLSQYWRELMTAPMPFLCNPRVTEILKSSFQIAPLEILITVIDERKDEFVSYLKRNPGEADLSDKICEGHIRRMVAKYANRIGERYEEVSNYRGAIPWYERGLMECKKRLGSEYYERHAEEVQHDIADLHCNLGLAQKKAGFLSKALPNYEASLKIRRAGKVVKNRNILLEEMNEWTGSSGKLTPGC